METFKGTVKTLFPSFANPETWRNNIHEKITKPDWRKLRQKILERDNFACQYCGFKAEKWQIVHHIDGNPNNNSENNLAVICQMCNLIEHAGMGCIIQGIVDLYKKSKCSQNEIITKTRELRARGKSDAEIIRELALEEKVEFKQDWNYLKPLFGFVTARKAKDEKTNIALQYEYQIAKSLQRKEADVMPLSDSGQENEMQQSLKDFAEPNIAMKASGITPEQIEEFTLLLLYSQAWKEGISLRAWKGYGFEVLNRLNEKGLVNDKRGRKSLYLTEKGIEKAKEILGKIMEKQLGLD